MRAAHDVGPVRVAGVVRAHRARVLWDDGILYVVHSASRIDRLETTQPKQSGFWWVADAATGIVKWTRKGCSG